LLNVKLVGASRNQKVKMQMIQEPKKVALSNKWHFEERDKKRRVCSMFKNFSMYIC
jgi:hypothetical protein